MAETPCASAFDFFILSIVSDYLRRGGVLVWSGLISFLSKVNKIDESDGST